MSDFPNNFDDDTTLPFVNDNITEIGGEAINALRDAVFAIEQNIGLGAQGSTASVAARLGVSFFPDGTLKPSAITSLGLVTLPITQDQIANHANIPESKLHLDHRTQDLFNYIRDLSKDVNLAIGWISGTGVKLEPHLIGAIYRHTMDQIDVSLNSNDFLTNNRRLLRNNLNSYTLVKDINAELLSHQFADGSPFGSPYNITTNNGSVYSSIYGHTGSAIFINTSRFNNIPQTADDVQLFAEFIDSASIFLLGTRIQNLYTNGISRVSRSSNLTQDGYGQFIVPPTPAIAFLKNIGNSSSPFDNIDTGDDIIEFKPTADEKNSNRFDAQFSLVKPGDIIRINYGTIEVPFVIKEKKYSPTGNKKYVVRIAGKNHFYAPNAIARIDKPLFNSNKYGELAISPVNNQFNATPSLIVNNPRGAQCLGVGFNPDALDENHYLLYIAFYPTGHVSDGYALLPGIDVTGNQGTTPGAYSLESVVFATNEAFRKVGFNYRLSAFSYGGEFGICLSDSYNNSAFSIVTTAMKADGTIDVLANNIAFPANVIDILPTAGGVGPDPLGLGPTGANVASPVYYSSYAIPEAALNPTKLFIPLRRNTYYVNGTEKERMNREVTQALDGYGDGYWVATIQDVSIPAGRVATTYRVPLDLSTSNLKPGKTLVVQPLQDGYLVDFGRYIIQQVVFGCDPANFTDITVYDSVHAVGASPSAVLEPFAQVKLYFGPDSVSFNTESSTDFSTYGNFKRHFEVYTDADGNTFTHERGRFTANNVGVNINGTFLNGSAQLNKLDIIRISPKLRGYQFGAVNKITLRVFNYSSVTGVYDGYLASYDGVSYTHYGPRITGRKGEVTRFYDETHTDFIEVSFDPNESLFDFSEQYIDFQLFPTLQLDDELMLLGTCQVEDATQIVSKIVDCRQFGNTSEKDLSTSVFDYMSVPEKYLHSNGIIRGFDLYQTFDEEQTGTMYLTGGVALVNGRLFYINNDSVVFPPIRESYQSAFHDVQWAVCLTDIGDYKIIPLLDVYPGGPSTSARLFTAMDAVSGTQYIMPAVTFSDIINTRKDLTVLYIVKTSVDGLITPTTFIDNVSDARRFVYKKDWGERPTLSYGTENGEFRTFTALESWLNYNYTWCNSVTLKGSFPSVTNLFQYPTRIRFFGDGTTQLNNSQGIQGSNVEFHNLTFAMVNSGTVNFTNVEFDHVVFGGATNSTFFGCNLKNSTFNVPAGTQLNINNSVVDSVTFNVTGSASFVIDNTTIKNCTFNFGGTTSFNVSGALAVMDGNNINFSSPGTTMVLTGNFKNNRLSWTTINNTISFSGNIGIVGNQFFSTVSTPISQFLTIQDGSNGTVTGNFFFRNNNVITAYIVGPALYTSGLVNITDNFFDNSTIDGTNQNLVSNLPLQWIYRDNLNAPATLNARRISSSGTYTVSVEDNIIALHLTGPITINLPSIALSPPGRTITIKDATGNCDVNTITLHADNTSDAIENIYADYIYNNPYGSIKLVAIIDPNGGDNGSGLPPKYMWSIV